MSSMILSSPSIILKRPLSKIQIQDDNVSSGDEDLVVSRSTVIHQEHSEGKIKCCMCKKKLDVPHKKTAVEANNMQEQLQEQENQLREELKAQHENEMRLLIERFNFILENEQTRSSWMLREAHRERKEKVAALTQQLECKNMAGLMYVVCAERTKSKIEKLQIVESFTRYIDMLNDILCDGQDLILNLSRGYKTAARVDFEWRQKMNAIVGEFQQFICNFSGTPPDQNQYLLDLPKLLEIDAPLEDNPDENPLEEDEPELPSPAEWEENKFWWQKLDEDCRPFVIFGDMGDMTPPERREALKKIKAAKTAPRRWKEYMFHDMFKHSHCPTAENLNLRDLYLDRLPISSTNWECQPRGSYMWDAKAASRRQTTQSMAANMGSILKLITVGMGGDPVTKANLLGARDSIEIQSATRLRDKSKSVDVGGKNKAESKSHSRRTSFLDEARTKEEEREIVQQSETKTDIPVKTTNSRKFDEEEILAALESTGLSKDATDSLEMIAKHVPDRDAKINLEKTCPIKACQRKHVDSFMRSLPPYMNASPFTHFKQTYEHYETCSPDQLQLLQERLEEKKKKDREGYPHVEIEPLLEWQDSVPGLATQTSDTLYDDDLPPCTCRDPALSPQDSAGAVYRMEDLIPIKQNLDVITKELLWDDEVQFNRFKVLGQPDPKDQMHIKRQLIKIKQDFTRDRLREIQKILKKHPSLLDIFQANTRC